MNQPTDYAWSIHQIETVKAYAFILNTIREFFNHRGYTEVRLPSIHPFKINEEIFELDFFDQPARLTSSNALYLDVYTLQLQKAFSIQQCFRPEKIRSHRHLSEFDMLEVSTRGFSLEQAITELSECLKFIVNKLANSPFSNLSPLDPKQITENEFPLITYDQVEKQYSLSPDGLGNHETDIAANGPVFITHFPKKQSSWRARSTDETETHARSFNLLLPNVGETADGNERQPDMEKIRTKLFAAGLETELGWYFRLLPHSNVLISGFGMGIERLAMWLLGRTDIRDIHPIYRDTSFSELLPQ
ncbi:MAG: amino acid--tRNA ligase-related protein [Candidatus Omnitrophota bacterium]